MLIKLSLPENLVYRRLENLVKKVEVLSCLLTYIPKSISVSMSRDKLVEMGYAVFRYFLRGLILVGIDKPEVYTIPSRLWGNTMCFY